MGAEVTGVGEVSWGSAGALWGEVGARRRVSIYVFDLVAESL
jgi:hypothetical protein